MPATLLTQLVDTNPLDTSAASGLAGSIRDLTSFLKVYLAVAHDDTGKLKADAISDSSSIADRSILGTKLADATVTQAKMASDSVDTVQLVDDAVLTTKIGDGQVTHAKLAPLAVENDNIGLLAVKAANIDNLTITGAQIAAATIDSTKLVGGSSVPAGSITPSQMAVAASPLSLLVLGTTTGAHQTATIGGILSATLVGNVLTFALNATTSTGATLTHVVQEGTGAITGGAWDTRTNLVRKTGADTIALLDGTNSYLKIVSNGTYLILFQANGYQCGDHVAALFHDASLLCVGSIATALITGVAPNDAAFGQTTSHGFYVLTVTGASTTSPYNLYLKTWGATARGADGMGVATALGAVTANTAQLLLVQL